MKVVIVGAGRVGTTVVEALHEEHDVTVVDADSARLGMLTTSYDVTAVRGDAASRRTLEEAGVGRANLLVACTSRDEINIVAALLAKKLSPGTTTVARTENQEYVELWRQRLLELDWMVSAELETAMSVSRTIGVPAARQTDVFADGQVQVVEFDIDDPANESGGLVGRPLRAASAPADSKVVAILRGDAIRLPRGDDAIEAGDRVVVIGSPQAAREWSRRLAKDKRAVEDVVVFGAGHYGIAIARVLLEQEIDVWFIEADGGRASAVAELLPEARMFHATGFDPEFLRRERISHVTAAVFALGDDARNHFGATLVKQLGVEFTVALVRDAVSGAVFERSGAVDVTINPRLLAAEEIVRFTYDPRTRQVAMLQGDRFEVLDVTVREGSRFAGKRFHELPTTGSIIGAIVRNGRAVFPHGDDVLLPGDRAIIFTESARAALVQQAL